MKSDANHIVQDLKRDKLTQNAHLVLLFFGKKQIFLFRHFMPENKVSG